MARGLGDGLLRLCNGAWRDNDGDAVDIVKVVRCKDCTNFERKFPGYGYCYHWDYEQGMSPNEVEDNDFCSYGERKTE